MTADVRLTDEQSLLADTVAHMVTRHRVAAPPPRGVMPFDQLVWERLVGAGLVGLRLDGGDALDVALVVEQLARGPVPVPYVGSVLALELLRGCAAATVLAEEVAAGRPAAIVVDDGLLALAAAGVAVDGRPGMLVVGADADGLCGGEVGTALDGVDLARPLGRVMAGTTHALAGWERQQLVRWECFARAIVCADLVGVMAGALEDAVGHAREREQFGRPIGSFQAVQHLCADQLVLVESSRSVMWYAAWAADALDLDEAVSATRVAKAYCSEVARTVCEAAVQVWGGMGMTWECRAHLHLRRALLSRRLLGDEDVHLDALAILRLAAAPSGADG